LHDVEELRLHSLCLPKEKNDVLWATAALRWTLILVLANPLDVLVEPEGERMSFRLTHAVVKLEDLQRPVALHFTLQPVFVEGKLAMFNVLLLLKKHVEQLGLQTRRASQDELGGLLCRQNVRVPVALVACVGCPPYCLSSIGLTCRPVAADFNTVASVATRTSLPVDRIHLGQVLPVLGLVEKTSVS